MEIPITYMEFSYVISSRFFVQNPYFVCKRHFLCKAGRGQRFGWPWRRRGRMRGLLLAQDTRGLVRQARKRCGLGGARAARRDGPGWLCLGRRALAGPGKVQHDKQPQESQDHELIVKLMWNHGKKPPHYGMIGGHFTRFSGRDNYPQRGGTLPTAPALQRTSALYRFHLQAPLRGL